MDVDRVMIAGESDVKMEQEVDGPRAVDAKSTYRSWKKKYRKMRINFDRKMHEGEELHRHEQKALATARRLAIEKDLLLDLLLDVNNSPQIPPDKRFDLRLNADQPGPDNGQSAPPKVYKQLLVDIPHSTYATASTRFPELFADLEAGRDSPADISQGQMHPPSFLTADDIDDYIWEADMRATDDVATLLPTLAPAAQANGAATNDKDAPITIASASRDFALRNPTSVYNWLRKHAPKTFLQDGEGHTTADKDNIDDHVTPIRGVGRAAKGERGGTGGAKSSATARSKRMSGAYGREKNSVAVESIEYMDDDLGHDEGTSVVTASNRSKRKRNPDEDFGYRPKGGSSRPSKRKRKSEGGDTNERTPSAVSKRPRKSVLGGDPARNVEDA